LTASEALICVPMIVIAMPAILMKMAALDELLVIDRLWSKANSS
jgi:hypothetical protein